MKTRSIVFFLVLTLILALCSFNVFAEEEAATTTSAPVTEDSAETEAPETEGDAAGETTADEDTATDTAEPDTSVDSDNADATESADDESGEDATDGESESEPEDTDAAEEEEEKKGISTGLIVFLAILGVIIVVLVVLWFVKPAFREKIKKFFREYKSELKKVVWASKADVISNTKLVVVVIVIVAVVIGLLDLGFGYLIDLVGRIGA